MHRVVVVGAGFGGLFATRHLKRAPVEVTVVDRRTHHLFQPLLYQVATGILSEGEIAPAIRDVLRKQDNASVMLGAVTDVDLDRRVVTARLAEEEHELPYDSLIVAAGAETSYFGNDGFAENAPGLKSIDDALEVRRRVFTAYERAELEDDPEERRRWLTFVVVGGGPTGVELAGQFAELAGRALSGNFRRIGPGDARIVLLDAAPKILGGFHDKLGEAAAEHLRSQGIELVLDAKVTEIDPEGVSYATKDGGESRVEARTTVWGAGVRGVPLGKLVAEKAGAEVDRGGRVKVRDDCSLPGHPEVFVVGDLMALGDLPGVAETAMQSGMHAARVIARRAEGGDPSRTRKFKYWDLGTMASISRHFAIVERGPIRITGFLGWLLWLVVHLTFLTGFKNRISALFHWIVSFVGRGRAERVFSTKDIAR